MNVVVEGREVTLADEHLLGVGGEARVFRVDDLAVKILHPTPHGLSAAEAAPFERARALKFEKLRRFPRPLPDAVIAPRALVFDRDGAPIGFVMPLVDRAHEAAKLSRRAWREGVVGNATVCRVFDRLRALLVELHHARVIIGDLNDGNVLVRLDPARAFLIDADSLQFPAFPCTVAHERFLDPRLYGADLARGLFDEGSDWFAFAVMLFSSLLYVHPYGGVHADHPTLLRRAEAKWSVLRDDVRPPRGAIDPRVLPDDLLSWFSRTFDRGARDPIPEALLPSIRWTRCTSCNLEHARIACPTCVGRAVAFVPAVTRHGRCAARVVVETRGRILAAAVQGSLKYVVEEEGVVRREDGTLVVTGAIAPDTRFVIAGPSTWIALGDRLVRIRDGTIEERTRTATFEGESVVDATAARAFRLQDDFLVDATLGTRVGSIVRGQTWFRVGDRLGFGAYRAGLLSFHFLFRVCAAGFVPVHLPTIAGRVVDRDVVFDEDHALYSLAVDHAGARTHHLFLIDARGEVIARASGRPDSHRMFASIHGKIVAGTKILAPTDDGLLLLEADPRLGAIGERTLFEDARSEVSADSRLLAAAGGAVFVVSPARIVRLDLA